MIKLICDVTNLKYLRFCGDYTEHTETINIKIDYKDLSKLKEST